MSADTAKHNDESFVMNLVASEVLELANSCS